MSTTQLSSWSPSHKNLTDEKNRKIVVRKRCLGCYHQWDHCLWTWGLPHIQTPSGRDKKRKIPENKFSILTSKSVPKKSIIEWGGGGKREKCDFSSVVLMVVSQILTMGYNMYYSPIMDLFLSTKSTNKPYMLIPSHSIST